MLLIGDQSIITHIIRGFGNVKEFNYIQITSNIDLNYNKPTPQQRDKA